MGFDPSIRLACQLRPEKNIEINPLISLVKNEKQKLRFDNQEHLSGQEKETVINKFIKKGKNKEEAEKFRIQSNNDFEETVRFANVYNRCIGFDAAEWHAANQFSQTNEEESRLTLIVFWHEISCAQTGLQRSEMEII